MTYRKWMASLLAGLIGTSALASPGGSLGTLATGSYLCGLPGDAGGDAVERVPARDFRIITASGYEAAQGTGTYLKTGDDVLFTRGPMKGWRFRLVGGTMLRVVDADGSLGDLRCVRRGR